MRYPTKVIHSSLLHVNRHHYSPLLAFSSAQCFHKSNMRTDAIQPRSLSYAPTAAVPTIEDPLLLALLDTLCTTAQLGWHHGKRKWEHRPRLTNILSRALSEHRFFPLPTALQEGTAPFRNVACTRHMAVSESLSLAPLFALSVVYAVSSVFEIPWRGWRNPKHIVATDEASVVSSRQLSKAMWECFHRHRKCLQQCFLQYDSLYRRRLWFIPLPRRSLPLRFSLKVIQVGMFPLWMLLTLLRPRLVHAALSDSCEKLRDRYAALPSLLSASASSPPLASATSIPSSVPVEGKNGLRMVERLTNVEAILNRSAVHHSKPTKRRLKRAKRAGVEARGETQLSAAIDSASATTASAAPSVLAAGASTTASSTPAVSSPSTLSSSPLESLYAPGTTFGSGNRGVRPRVHIPIPAEAARMMFRSPDASPNRH